MVSFHFRFCFHNIICNPNNINNYVVYLRGRPISNTAPPSFDADIVPLCNDTISFASESPIRHHPYGC